MGEDMARRYGGAVGANLAVRCRALTDLTRCSTMAADPDCLFCKIAAGEIPATRVYEDERTIAFMDINPGTRGHLLVIPREHATDLLVIDPEDLAACVRTAQIMAARASDRLEADGVNLLNSCGAQAWQTIFHFHVH